MLLVLVGSLTSPVRHRSYVSVSLLADTDCTVNVTELSMECQCHDSSTNRQTTRVKVSSNSADVLQCSTVLRTDQGTLHFTSWQTCSTEHHLDFSGKHPAILQLMHKDYSYTNIHHCLQPIIHYYSRTPHLRPPLKSEWSGLKRGVVSREGFGYFDVLD